MAIQKRMLMLQMDVYGVPHTAGKNDLENTCSTMVSRDSLIPYFG